MISFGGLLSENLPCFFIFRLAHSSKYKKTNQSRKLIWHWKELIQIIIYAFSLMFIEIYNTIWELLTLWRVPHLNHAWYTRKISSKYKKTNQPRKLIWNWKELIQNIIMTIQVFSLIFIELYNMIHFNKTFRISMSFGAK